ncbi:isochorismatase domain containing 2, partial [Chelydra serpentina]
PTPQVAQLLEIPVVVTEQYPQGLGPTVPELGAEGLRKFPKTCFSMLVPEVEQELGALPHLRSVLLCGIETQACIMVPGGLGGDPGVRVSPLVGSYLLGMGPRSPSQCPGGRELHSRDGTQESG